MDAPKFIQLKPKEEVMQVVHASIVPHFGRLFLLFIWFILPFFFLFPLWRQGTWGIAVFFVWLFSGCVLFYRGYARWGKTVFVVTDRRIIDVEQKGVFHRVVTEARYAQIDEVSYHIKGFFPTIFRYGAVRLQLHGSAADIQVDYVSRPSRVTDLINDLRSEHHEHAST
jgi:hypothetical protein